MLLGHFIVFMNKLYFQNHTELRLFSFRNFLILIECILKRKVYFTQFDLKNKIKDIFIDIFLILETFIPEP
jgi:hypothetical protein